MLLFIRVAKLLPFLIGIVFVALHRKISAQKISRTAHLDSCRMALTDQASKFLYLKSFVEIIM